MKIEMGESLFYSWLRHVKECQIVQTNWKVSQKWNFKNAVEIDNMLQELDTYFAETYNYKVFKKNTSLDQIIRQGECDALGICMQNGDPTFYAVDVAIHEGGLNYGSKNETVLKVISKCIRTAFCLNGYFNTKAAEIVFASPKIHRAILKDLLPLIDFVNTYFAAKGFSFHIRLICNDDFATNVLEPILLVSGIVADTSELFMRAYQILAMFEDKKPKIKTGKDSTSSKTIYGTSIPASSVSIEPDAYGELKIGQIVRTVLRRILESGVVSEKEIEDMQTAEYSKDTFDIQYPLLSPIRKERYYAAPLSIKGKTYYLCSEWFEVAANNDRPYLLAWIKKYISDSTNE